MVFPFCQGTKFRRCAELEHRGQAIKDKITSRSQQRRRRRSGIKYRQPRFDNRRRKKGWIPPSLNHRVQTTETWVKKLVKFSPIKEIWIESVKFDLSKMQNPEISGTEYQKGTLAGYEVREYLLEKWQRKCAYCGKTHVPLQVEHIYSKSKGGSNRVSNLTIACECCNQKKGSLPVEEFLKNKPKLLSQIQEQAKKPLKDAAAVNTTRNKIVDVLSDLLPTFTSTGAQTKQNRILMGLPKQHWVDAACVGEVQDLILTTNQPLKIKSTGKNTRQKVITDKYGFPKSYRPQNPEVKGFKTGDLVKAVVTKGKYIGEYIGRIAVRARGSFALKVGNNKPFDVSYKYCKTIQQADSYNYSF